jgi:ComF family protein
MLDFLIPRFCISCSNKLGKKEHLICNLCFSQIEIASEKRIKEEFNRKFSGDKCISDFCSAFVFHDESEIQKLIHSLKYEQNYHVGIFLGIKTGQILHDLIEQWRADLIVPVPLHHLRKAERGFNQSKEISKGLSKELGIKKNSMILKRNRFTQTQTKFTLTERKSNIAGAFSIKNNKKIQGKTIILVDDVITTGATTTECAKLLIENGAERVYALSVAIAA